MFIMFGLQPIRTVQRLGFGGMPAVSLSKSSHRGSDAQLVVPPPAPDEDAVDDEDAGEDEDAVVTLVVAPVPEDEAVVEIDPVDPLAPAPPPPVALAPPPGLPQPRSIASTLTSIAWSTDRERARKGCNIPRT